MSGVLLKFSTAGATTSAGGDGIIESLTQPVIDTAPKPQPEELVLFVLLLFLS
jgi:hypothetical protein